MHLQPAFPARNSLSARTAVLALAAFGLCTPSVWAQAKKKNPASKVYVSDVSGEAVIDTGDAIEDLSKRAVYLAQGAVIETKRPERESDRNRYFSTVVYSNGTGAFFDADTRVEVKRFQQEPFTPNRTDVEVEPSISQTQAFVVRGTVGLCTSKLVAGSSMNYQTAHGSINVRGRKVVIEAGPDFTKVSMLEGESSIRAGAMDMGGQTVRAGEQAIIRRGAPGQPNDIRIQRIPQGEAPQLDDKVAMACMAKKTVYFDVREKSATTEGAGEGGEGPVTAFDGADGAGGATSSTEIVPIETVPSELPTQFTVSPATIGSSGRGPGG